MSLVTINLDQPTREGNAPAATLLRWRPSARFDKGGATVLPFAFTVPLDGVTRPTIEVSDTGPGWCWEVEEVSPGVTGEYRSTRRYLAVSGDALYSDLAEVDPDTLDPAAEPEAAWWASVDGLHVRADTTDGNVAALGVRVKALEDGGGLGLPIDITDVTGLSLRLESNQALAEAASTAATGAATSAAAAQAEAVEAGNAAIAAQSAAGNAATAAQTAQATADDALAQGAGLRTDLTAATDALSAVEDEVFDHNERLGLIPGLLAAKADLGVDGKLRADQLPLVALREYLGPVGSQAGMLALTGQPGDWCTRTDVGRTFELVAWDPTQLVSWVAMESAPGATLGAPGTTSGAEAVPGNDSRLSDPRTPTAHTHAPADVTGLVDALTAFQGGIQTAIGTASAAQTTANTAAADVATLAGRVATVEARTVVVVLPDSTIPPGPDGVVYLVPVEPT